MWDQLTKVADLSSHVYLANDRTVVDLYSEDNMDNWKYEILFNPFRINLFVNGELTTIVNNRDSLRYAPHTAPHNTYTDGVDELIEGYEIALGFTFSAENVYGLPQRAINTFSLKKNTQYHIFNQDYLNHPYGNEEPLYGNWPYITGHSASMDASAVWMNAAETYVNIETLTHPISNKPATQVDFISVGGKFEFFMFGSTSGPKNNQKKLNTITGFAPLPPLHSLGFHYCKWEHNTAALLRDRNRDFDKYKFPVDVLWSDLYYTANMEYFIFNKQTWPQSEIELLN